VGLNCLQKNNFELASGSSGGTCLEKKRTALKGFGLGLVVIFKLVINNKRVLRVAIVTNK